VALASDNGWYKRMKGICMSSWPLNKGMFAERLLKSTVSVCSLTHLKMKER